MNRLIYISLLIILSTQIALAEEYERIERRNLWNSGQNVTGILRDSISISYAELHYSSEQGDFCNFSDGSKELNIGAEAKTITHFDRVSMVGAFSYDHMDGEEMSGSIFIRPNQYPFDILEFTPGDKRLQSYYLMGGIASQLNDHWSIGVKGEFGAQNYAKFKDLRHYNYRMELSLMPSIAYQIGDITIGATYIYSRNSETIRVQEIGSTAAAYYAFLDKGLMTGAYETWGGTGVHLNESGVDGFPVRENFNGFALQAEWRELYGEFEYLRGRGEVGEKLTYWFDFPSQHYTARLGYRVIRGNKLHLFKVEAQLYSLSNSENVLGSETVNGITTTKIYASNEIFTVDNFSLSPSYEVMILNGGSAKIGANLLRSYSRSTQMYPYVDELKTNCYQLYISGMLPIKRWELRAGTLFSMGDIDEDSYRVSDDIDAGDKPTQLIEYYNIENEYLTATKLISSLSLRYNLPRSLYCQAGVSYIKAFDLSYIEGSNRWSYEFTVGYKF